jgi:uncharacterized membrane protein
MYLSLRYDDRLLSLGLPVVSRLPVGRLPISLLSVWNAVTWGLLGLLGDDYCGSVVVVPVVHGVHGGLLLELFCLSFAVAVADEGDDDDGSDDGTDNCSTDGSDAGTAAVVVPAGVVVGGGVVGVVFWAVSIVVAAIVVAIVAVADHVWSAK